MNRITERLVEKIYEVLLNNGNHKYGRHIYVRNMEGGKGFMNEYIKTSPQCIPYTSWEGGI